MVLVAALCICTLLPSVSAISVGTGALQPEPLNLIQGAEVVPSRRIGSKDIPDPLTAGSNPAGISGYVPIATPYTNPNDKMLTGAAFAIPESSECTVRAQTVIEIEKVRKTAAQMAASIGLESNNIATRKSFIETMTSYINDRIRELNKIKKDLGEELRWVEATNKNIELLNQQEQEMKVQDILACMSNDRSRLDGSQKQQSTIIEDLTKKAKLLDKTILEKQTSIMNIKDGKEEGGSAEAGGAPVPKF